MKIDSTPNQVSLPTSDSAAKGTTEPAKPAGRNPLKRLSRCIFSRAAKSSPTPKQPQSQSMRETSQNKLLTPEKAFQPKSKQILQGLVGGREKAAAEAASENDNESLASGINSVAEGSMESLEAISTFIPGVAAVGLGVVALKKLQLSEDRKAALAELLTQIDSSQTEAVIDEVSSQHDVEKVEALGLILSSLSSTGAAIESGLTIANITAGTAALAALATVSGVGTAAYGAALFIADQDKINHINALMPSIVSEAAARETMRNEANTKGSEVSLEKMSDSTTEGVPTPKTSGQPDLNDLENSAEFDKAYQQFFKEYKQLLTASQVNSAVMVGASSAFALSGILTLGAALPITTALIGATGFTRLTVLEPRIDNHQFKPVVTEWGDIYDMRSRETRVSDHANLDNMVTELAEHKKTSVKQYGLFNRRVTKPLTTVLGNFPALRKIPNWSDKLISNANMRSNRLDRVQSFAQIQSDQIKTITTTVEDMLKSQKNVLEKYQKADKLPLKSPANEVGKKIEEINAFLGRIEQVKEQNNDLINLLENGNSKELTVDNINGHLETLQTAFSEVLGDQSTSIDDSTRTRTTQDTDSTRSLSDRLFEDDLAQEFTIPAELPSSKEPPSGKDSDSETFYDAKMSLSERSLDKSDLESTKFFDAVSDLVSEPFNPDVSTQETDKRTESNEPKKVKIKTLTLNKKAAGNLNKRAIETINEFEKTATALRTNLYYLQATDDFQLNQAKADFKKLDAPMKLATNQYKIVEWLSSDSKDQSELPMLLSGKADETTQTANFNSIDYNTQLAQALSDPEFKEHFEQLLGEADAKKQDPMLKTLQSIEGYQQYALDQGDRSEKAPDLKNQATIRQKYMLAAFELSVAKEEKAKLIDSLSLPKPGA